MIPKSDMLKLYRSVDKYKTFLRNTNHLNKVTFFDGKRKEIIKYVRVWQTVFYDDLAFLHILNLIYK